VLQHQQPIVEQLVDLVLGNDTEDSAHNVNYP
jgi:hypothetical protein